MNEFDMKAAVMGYFRYKRGALCATEVCLLGRGLWLSDVVADTGKDIVEVEIKVSVLDFRQEWKTKADKHLQTAQGRMANKVYFAFPEDIRERLERELLQMHPEYGVIGVSEYGTWIQRSAKRIREDYDATLRGKIAMRASSEIICLMKTVRSQRADVMNAEIEKAIADPTTQTGRVEITTGGILQEQT